MSHIKANPVLEEKLKAADFSLESIKGPDISSKLSEEALLTVKRQIVAAIQTDPGDNYPYSGTINFLGGTYDWSFGESDDMNRSGSRAVACSLRISRKVANQL